MSNVEDSSITTHVNGLRHTQLLMVVYYLLAEIWGVRSIWYWQPSRLDILVPVALAVALGSWAIVDARQRGMSIPMVAQPWFLLLAGIVVPGYLIWSRRWRGLAWFALHTGLWLFLATVAMHIGGILVFGMEWTSGFVN